MIQEKLNIAVFVDYDNIEIGVKSTLRREFRVSLVLAGLKERGDLIAKFAYANWNRQEFATRHMSENAVQMVQRQPSPRGDKNGADINLALDALEMAFTHKHVNAFAIVSGDSDFISLVNKLKEYGKTVFIVGGKAFTSTILQQNCHEFISYESLLDDTGRDVQPPPPPQRVRQDQPPPRQMRRRPPPLDLAQSVPLVERALQVLERRNVQPQLGLLKSTMLQLDSSFNEKAYGAGSFSDFVEKLKSADYVNVTGSGGRLVIERKTSAAVPEKSVRSPEEVLPTLRDVLETHRIDMEVGQASDQLAQWMSEEAPDFVPNRYGFQEFAEFLNFAQDKTIVRIEPDEEKGLMVYLGAEFYPPVDAEAAEPVVESPLAEEEEEEEKQPIVPGQPSFLEPTPPPAPEPMHRKPRGPRRPRPMGPDGGPMRRPRRRKG